MRKANLLLLRSCLVIGLAALPLVARAQDPVKLAPEMYKVAIDNADARALDITIKPGGKVAMHSHPASVITAYTPCKLRFTSPDGKSSEAEFKPGDIAWRDAESHAGENIGAADCHVLQVELKHAKPAAKKAK
jgi:quercetin dioxygenase-like cupin family protein